MERGAAGPGLSGAAAAGGDAGLAGRNPPPASWNYDNVGPGGTVGNLKTPRQPYPLIIGGAPGGAMVGGVFTTEIPYSRDGSLYNNSAGAFAKDSSGFTFWGQRNKDAWDAVRFTGEAGSEFRLAHSWISGARDDAIENDRLRSLVIENCLIEDVFVGISIDPGAGYSGADQGAAATVEIRNTLMEISRKLSGDVPNGSPGWLKSHVASPGVKFDGAVLKFSAMTRAMERRLPRMLGPKADKFRGATDSYILWTGEGDFPATFPASIEWLESNGFKVLTGAEAQQHWDAARAAWIDAHPFVPRAAGDPAVPEPAAVGLLGTFGLLWPRSLNR